MHFCDILGGPFHGYYHEAGGTETSLWVESPHHGDSFEVLTTSAACIVARLGSR